MKRLLTMISAVWLYVSADAQNLPSNFPLPVTTDKTTSLVFPYAIRHIDRGTLHVLAEQVPNAENILLVKAATAQLKPTNLTVVTVGGEVYCFDVSFSENPEQTVYWFSSAGTALLPQIIFSNGEKNEKELETYAKAIVDNAKCTRGIKDNVWDVIARVVGIYVRKNVIFFQLSLKNASPLDYDVNHIRFYIKDKRESKRTASQEVELPVLYQVGNWQHIRTGQQEKISFALEKFTIPDAKYFFIEIGEKNGGRHLRLKVSNRKLLKAKLLPEFH